MAMSQIMSVFNYPRMTETSNLSGTTTILSNRNIWELYFSNIPINILYYRFILCIITWALKESHFFKICISLQKCKRLSLFICLLAIVFPCLLIPYILCTYFLLAISLYYWFVAVIFIFFNTLFFINVENIFFLFMDGNFV